MVRKFFTCVALTFLWFLPFSQPAEGVGNYATESHYKSASERRDAADLDESIERGLASVTGSPQFPAGIRLNAGAADEDEFEPGMASAIYHFDVPDWANYVKIMVWYEDLSKDDDIAGRLWIKTTDEDSEGKVDSRDETLFYGDTFVLRADRSNETVYVPSARHVEDGNLELHIVASRRDSLDVQYILVEYLRKKPARIEVVYHYYDDYWNWWPPSWYAYHYYYWGPYYWPWTPLIYIRWVWPHDYYWYRYRPWYHLHVVKYFHRHPYGHRRHLRFGRRHRGNPSFKARVVSRRWHREIGRAGIGNRRKGSLPNTDVVVNRGPDVRPSSRRQTAEREVRGGRRERLPSARIERGTQRRARFRTAPRVNRSRSAYRGRSLAGSRTGRSSGPPMRSMSGGRGGRGSGMSIRR